MTGGEAGDILIYIRWAGEWEEQMKHFIEFKAKANNGKIKLKKTVTKSDTNLKPHEHPYFNSDLFNRMLGTEYRRITEGRLYIDIASPPAGVVVDGSGFLSKVRVELPESFFLVGKARSK